ncbi:hypothetical protein FHX14_005530 [Rhizobium sp. BK619]|nr:hypothetical protein [Rhizobium sp. BK619]MBB3746971.1 hypothetical protein [Rhizobium sp. BK591]
MAIEKIPQPYSGRNGPDIEAEFLADMGSEQEQGEIVR